jgi:DUF2934 family protein
MKMRKQTKMQHAVNLSADDHLRVQKEIERRAHELWLAGGCRQTASLHDWLQAEREIMEQFIRDRFRRRPSQRETANLRSSRDKLRIRFAPAGSCLPPYSQKKLTYEFYL